MSAHEPAPKPDPRPEPREDRRPPLGLILAVLLLAYAAVFVVINSDDVKINFLFFSARTSLIVAILLALALGFGAGYLARGVRDRRTRSAATN